MSTLDLPVDEIARRYVEEGESIRVLATAYGCSHDTIVARLRGAGVTMRNRGGQAKAENIRDSKRRIETERLREQRDEQATGLRVHEPRICPRCTLTLDSSGAAFVRHVKGCGVQDWQR